MRLLFGGSFSKFPISSSGFDVLEDETRDIHSMYKICWEIEFAVAHDKYKIDISGININNIVKAEMQHPMWEKQLCISMEPWIRNVMSLYFRIMQVIDLHFSGEILNIIFLLTQALLGFAFRIARAIGKFLQQGFFLVLSLLF